MVRLASTESKGVLGDVESSPQTLLAILCELLCRPAFLCATPPNPDLHHADVGASALPPCVFIHLNRKLALMPHYGSQQQRGTRSALGVIPQWLFA